MTIVRASSNSGAFSKSRILCSPAGVGARTTLIALALLVSAATFTRAQSQARPVEAAPLQANSSNAVTAALSLPDSPGFLAGPASSSSNPGMLEADDPFAVPIKQVQKLFSHRTITIEPGQTVPVLTPHQKVVLGLTQSFNLFSVVGWVASAGYSQITNGSPNYGRDSGAFGMRLGATAIRATSENVLGNAVFAPLFHEDPRYYKLGNGHNPIKRIAYAATRAIITRRDDGSPSANFHLLAGNLAGAALTDAYYPRLNQGFGPTAKTFGTSVGGSAVGFVVSEFLYDALDYVHMQRLRNVQ